ncbi:MAG: hypothetical protein WBA74_07065 [Cyclobacteriaceae bacterium]
MAKATPELIEAIRKTAKKLESGAPYQWGHMGSCNCGNLAQEITDMTDKQIHDYAMKRHGDWQEQVIDYCPTSGLPMDYLISKLLDAGLTTIDLQNLERLSDKEVLNRLKSGKRHLKHNLRNDVILYMKAWADLLEEEISKEIEIEKSLFVRKKELEVIEN